MADVATRGAGPASGLWDSLRPRVDGYADRAPGVADLVWHRLEVFAAQRRRAAGRTVEPELRQAERIAALAAMNAPVLLQKVQAVLDQPILLLKGYEVAVRYPDPVLRSFSDLDLLVADSKSAQQALIDAGLREVRQADMFIGAHHERTLLLWPYPLLIELHHSPKWPSPLEAPSGEELLALAAPSETGVDGLLTLPPAHHAVLLAAHSWSHVPLRRIRDFVDIAVFVEGVDRRELAEIARGWGLERIWATTIRTVDSLLADGRPPAAQRLWARNLRVPREQTVLEMHVGKFMSPFWALAPGAALRSSLRTMVAAVTPAEGERWGDKLRRTMLALRNLFVGRMAHDKQRGGGSHQRRRP